MESVVVLEIIVCVLALLVTVLIGWNIYSVIDLKKTVNQFMLIKNEYDKHIRVVEDGVIASRGQIEEDFAMMFGEDYKEFSKVIPHTLKAIYCWSKIGRFDKANDCVDFLLLVVKFPEKIVVTTKEKNDWIRLLKIIPNPNDIKNIELVYSLLLKLDVK